MSRTDSPTSATLPRDLTAGLVTFLVALPLCQGVALASGAPPPDRLAREGEVAIVGAMYDVGTRTIEFLPVA